MKKTKTVKSAHELGQIIAEMLDNLETQNFYKDLPDYKKTEIILHLANMWLYMSAGVLHMEC